MAEGLTEAQKRAAAKRIAKEKKRKAEEKAKKMREFLAKKKGVMGHFARSVQSRNQALANVMGD